MRNTLDPLDVEIADDAEPDEQQADLAAFEREYQDDHSWELLQEDEFGNLLAVDSRAAAREQRHRALTASRSTRIKRGLIRYLTLVIDLSRAAGMNDMRPLRAVVIFNITQQFIRTFFDENPLSQLGIIILKDGLAHRLTELSSSPEIHIQRLKASLDISGDASLQNGLESCLEALSGIPPYGHKEVLFIFSALATCDPSNVLDSIKEAVAAKVRVSVVGVAAEVYICRLMAQKTGGSYGVALDEGHLEDLILAHATPPPSSNSSNNNNSSKSSLVMMGFPNKEVDAPGASTFVGTEAKLSCGAFVCPRCKARTAALPAQCHVCGLTLVSSPHLARSYHHLFPIKPFDEVSNVDNSTYTKGGGGNIEGGGTISSSDVVVCYGCSTVLKNSTSSGQQSRGGIVAVQCPDCAKLYCYDCDVFIHESLHTCPGCEVTGGGS